jgi:hypothetical protein
MQPGDYILSREDSSLERICREEMTSMRYCGPLLISLIHLTVVECDIKARKAKRHKVHISIMRLIGLSCCCYVQRYRLDSVIPR